MVNFSLGYCLHSKLSLPYSRALIFVRFLDCNLISHESCAERVTTSCEPQLSCIAQVFGTDLTVLVKAAGGCKPPFVIEKCVTEIEARGLNIEGIYRVSGSREQTERLKKYLEQGKLS